MAHRINRSLDKHMHRWVAGAAALLAVSLLTTGTVTASADVAGPTLPNGDFEAGTLTAWHVSERGALEGGWSADQGTRSPVTDRRIPAPPQGTWQAVVDPAGPSSHVLYRDISVTEQNLRLRMDLWYRNRADRFFTPPTLGIERRNQQLRVDLIRPGAALRSMAADDILATVFRTRVGDPLRMDPRVVGRDLSRFEGRTVRLRVAVVSTQFIFNAGVDAVRLVRVEG